MDKRAQQALLIRRVEERILGLFEAREAHGTTHTCIGQEFSAVALGQAITAQDVVFSNHRGHGHYLATGGSLEGLFREILHGIGGSQHLHHSRFWSHGIQAGLVPVAAGYAEALRGHGAAVCCIGDGTLGQGVVYETWNLAALWKLPVVFMVECNGYAQSTPTETAFAGSLQERAKAFRCDYAQGTTWDWQALCDGLRAFVTRARVDCRPGVFQVATYRLAPHSKGHDERAAQEVEAARAQDPLSQMDTAPYEAQIAAQIDAAVERARVSPRRRMARVPPHAPTWRAAEPFVPRTGISAVRKALSTALQGDGRVLIGEDVEDPAGGAFKVTRGVPGTRNTPISEAAIVGYGTGYALAGGRPVVELMFGDFALLAMDQWANTAAKLHGLGHDVPLVVRTPMGGRRGYGPVHSQSLEKHLVGVPGTRVVCLHHRYPPQRVYDALDTTPTLVIENKLLYSRKHISQPLEGWALQQTDERFPTVRLRRAGARVAIVAFGGAGWEAEQALPELLRMGIPCDLYLPVQLYPLRVDWGMEGVQGIVTVEEGEGYAGLGAEVLAQAGRPGVRVSASSEVLPADIQAEADILPSTEQVINAALEVAHA